MMTDAHPSNRERSTADAGAQATDPELDRRIVAAQIGRDPRAMDGVGARCVFGMPAATKQAPRDADGRPFPTAFYLTCPHLVKQIDRLEAAGGVRRYEQRMADDGALREATLRSHARHRELDGRDANIAAATDLTRLKCLHAHAAFALSAGDHPLGDQVLAEAAPRWCDDARCSSLISPTDA